MIGWVTDQNIDLLLQEKVLQIHWKKKEVILLEKKNLSKKIMIGDDCRK